VLARVLVAEVSARHVLDRVAVSTRRVSHVVARVAGAASRARARHVLERELVTCPVASVFHPLARVAVTRTRTS
jgi:hypothetical protein